MMMMLLMMMMIMMMMMMMILALSGVQVKFRRHFDLNIYIVSFQKNICECFNHWETPSNFPTVLTQSLTILVRVPYLPFTSLTESH